jgi:hypothetical protein
MSGINAIGDSTSSSRQIIQPQPSSKPAQSSAASSALQEANETEATTRQEAAKGDQVAIRKLARQHKNRHTPRTPSALSNAATPSNQTAPPSTRSAAPGGLNVSA